MWSGGVPSASCLAKFSAAKCPSWGTLVNKIKGGKSDPTTTLTASAADRAASLGAIGSLISAKGVAGPSVPGARAGEWEAKAAKAKKEKEDKEREKEREEERRESAATSVSALSPSSLPPVVPSAATYDPDDVPERVVVAESGGR